MARKMLTSPPGYEATPGAVEKIISGKKYIVRSVFVGEQEVQTMLLELAERRAIREMGLDRAIP